MATPTLPQFSLTLSSRLMACGLAGLALLGSPMLHAEDLIANDHFADGGSSWTMKASKGGAASISVEKDGSDNVLCVQVDKASEESLDVRIYKAFGALDPGKTYRVNFRAKCDQHADVVVFAYPETNMPKVLFRTQATVDADWKDFSFEFKVKENQDGCVLGFSHLGELSAKYYFADVTLVSD